MTSELELAKKLKQAADFFRYYSCLNERAQDNNAQEFQEKLAWLETLSTEIVNMRKDIKIEMAKDKVAPWLARVVRKDT